MLFRSWETKAKTKKAMAATKTQISQSHGVHGKQQQHASARASAPPFLRGSVSAVPGDGSICVSAWVCPVRRSSKSLSASAACGERSKIVPISKASFANVVPALTSLMMPPYLSSSRSRSATSSSGVAVAGIGGWIRALSSRSSISRRSARGILCQG